MVPDVASAGVNILFLARSCDSLARGLAARGHTLAPFFSLADFSHSSALADADAIVVDLDAADEELVEAWRSSSGDRLPMIVIGAVSPNLGEEPDLLALPSSVSAASLDACLRMLVENGNARRRIEALQERLNDNRRQMRQVLEQFIPRRSLEDVALRWWAHDSDDLNGLLLLAARTPTGVLNVMTAEGAANALPIITPFYRMTEKGFSIEAILGEMNTRLLRLRPEGFPLPASLTSLDFKAGTVRTWDSGGASPLLLKGGAKARPRIARRQAPAGVAGIPFRPEPEVWTIREGDRLLLCSAGLMAALDADLHQSGVVERLEWLIEQGLTEKNPLAALPGTEKMLVVVDCSPSRASIHAGDQRPSSPERIGKPSADSAEGCWKLELTIGPDEMRKVDVVPLLLGVASQFEAVEQQVGHLFLILAELYNNALDHGVLRLDSRLKCGPDGMTDYLEERSRRLAELTSGSIEIGLCLESRELDPALWVICRDSGIGFDHRQVREQLANDPVNALPFGRGLSLVESQASHLEFNDAGNEVKVRLSLATRRGDGTV